MDLMLRVGGGPVEQLVPVRFIGSPAHGIVCAERSDVDGGVDIDRWRTRLVRLERPAVAQLERMLLDRERIAIPAAELDRFASELCPGLRHIAPVVSSDGSFAPPTVSAPSLVLRAEHGPETLVRSAGSGNTRSATRCTGCRSTTRATPLGFATTPPSGRGLLRSRLTSPHSRVFRCSIPPAVRRAARRRSCRGLDSLRFVDRSAPATGGAPGGPSQGAGRAARLPRRGRVARGRCVDWGDCRRAGLVRPWHDDQVDGRELPFVEVFTALARGESWMLLDDGAYFSLDDPRLESLRRLIEEARALADSRRVVAADQPLPGGSVVRTHGARRCHPSRPSGGSGSSRPCLSSRR